MLKLGLRVVRGPDWSWQDEDGGEGYTGTLYHIDNTDKTVIIQWDNGNQTLCKIGQMGTYELRVVDNAQIGVIHLGVTCDACSSDGRINSPNSAGIIVAPQFDIDNDEDAEHWGISCDQCKSGYIRGRRYKCYDCYDYDLCRLCYHGNKHELSHTFLRIDSQNCAGIILSPRLKRRGNHEQEIVHKGIHCDGCNSRNIQGIRYKCNNCYDYDLCDLCYHRNKHHLSHSFKKIDSPDCVILINLPPRLTSRRNLKAGSVHEGVRCDACNLVNIHGFRYKCKNCYNYDLCDSCYHGNTHDPSHIFIRVDLPNNLGVYLVPLLTSMKNHGEDTVHKGINCDGCNSRNIQGIRYKCNNCYDYDLCDFCYRGNKHDLSHVFKRITSPNGPIIDLPPRLNFRSIKGGTIHSYIQCDACNLQNIHGIRYKCNICPNYDLCETCYNANKHDINHYFRRLDCRNSVGVNLPPRLTSTTNENEDNINENIFWEENISSDICGMRYKCNNCNNYDLCYMCYHGDKHDMSHSFTRLETPHSLGIKLPPRLASRKCQLRGIFKNARVIQGIDWDYGNQNGDQDRPGIVLRIDRFNSHDSWRSAAYVKWLEGEIQLCRLGYKGYCDIQFVEPAPDSRLYYPEHLPVLGQSEEEMMLLEVVREQEAIQDDEYNDIDESDNETLNATKESSKLVGSTSRNNTASNLDQPTVSDDQLKVKQLESKIAQMEESQTCAVCLENKRDIVFLCGHGTCSICADALVSCHLCRKTIEKKIRIY
ncbi:uncharacterized protein LOC108915038 [Anoplophora glabripennis]|nr:uncharacterized protein LOC108915038 [Anoplophora glabripennis]